MIRPDVIGIIPAAGHARRLGRLPCSKEIFPIGFQHDARSDQWRPKVVAHYLLEHFRDAGICEAIIIVRPDKSDIPRFLGHGHAFGVNLSYRTIIASPCSPISVDAAFECVRGRTVALGFPDILFNSRGIYEPALSRLHSTGADIVLGLFPAQYPEMVDMVEMNPNGDMIRIEIKPSKTSLVYQWAIAVWNARFSQFMHDFLDEGLLTPQRYSQLLNRAQRQSELYMSDVVIAAQQHGLKVQTEIVSNLPCLDIGTPQTLSEAIRRYARLSHDDSPF